MALNLADPDGTPYACLPSFHPLLPSPPRQVLGRSEFKQLLRWRLLVKKDLQRAAAAAAKAAAEAGGGEGGEGGGSGEEAEDPEERLLREMGEIKDRCAARPACPPACLPACLPASLRCLLCVLCMHRCGLLCSPGLAWQGESYWLLA